jgi:predicted DNA-binding transcriptional regulator AlpA
MASQSEQLVLSASPYPDESFAGYLTRLTDLNLYDSPSWIRQLANLGSYETKEAVAFPEAEKLGHLSKLAGVSVSQLLGITHRRQRANSTHSAAAKFFGLSVPRSAIHLRTARICPACLRENGYVRRIWELTLITTCPIHKCLLVDECPKCHRSVPFLRPRLNLCGSGHKLQNIKAAAVKEHEMELTRRVQALCKLEGAWETPEQNSYLGALELHDLIQIVSLISSQYYLASYGCGARAVDTTTRWLRSIKLKDVHELLCKAMHAFREWPTNFFAFLDWRARHLQSDVRLAGVQRDFGELWSALHRKPLSPVFDFVRDAFETYLKRFWRGGHASQIRRLKDRGQTRYVSKPQALKILGIASETIDRLIERDELKSHIETRGNRRLILIARADIDHLKARRKDLIDRLQTARRLGINTDQTQVLVRAGFLTEREAYDLRSGVFYSIKEIDALVQKTTAARKRVRLRPKTGTIGFAEALRDLSRRYDITVAQFVQAIIDREIRPCKVTDGVGFRALQFLRHDVLEYRDSIFNRRHPGALNTLQAAKALDAPPTIIRFLIQRKLLHGEMVHLRLFIPQGAISDFCSKYILTKTLAKQLGTSARYLTNILEMEGIAPTPESVSQLKPSHYVFNRSDIDRVNLDELIKTKRKGISSYSRLLDITGAAQLVHTQPEILSDLAANGVITTWSSKTRQLLDKNCFRETQLERLIGKVDKYVGLVTANIAAQMWGRSVSNFNDRLVKSNALAAVHVDGDRRRFFRKSNVEKVVAKMKNLVGAADVRARLNLGETQLIRLTESGELKPVSGLNVDGFGHNLFSKHDVEIVRKQRESFKRKRALEGGSQRFGKPTRPQRSPVVEAITPRVSELMNEASVNGTRMSAATIHKHLIKKGHKICITSVYVCIRKIRSVGSVQR